MSVSYINDIEHDRRVPSLLRLTALADALDTTVVAVLAGVPPYDLSSPKQRRVR